MIEPKLDKVSLKEFEDLKTSKIEPELKKYEQYEITENFESTSKKLIYQIAFTHVQCMP
jgi:hypothetical protein